MKVTFGVDFFQSAVSVLREWIRQISELTVVVGGEEIGTEKSTTGLLRNPTLIQAAGHLRDHCRWQVRAARVNASPDHQSST